MKRSKGNTLFIAGLSLLFLFQQSFSQKQYNIWYFGHSGDLDTFSGYGAGLDFNTGTPSALTNSAMGFTEGCATYCNSSGQLLFYTNGDTVWNKNHQVMFNGEGLGGHFSSMQSVVITPVKNNPDKYYLFSNDGFPTGNGSGLHYSTIDMTLDGGLGGITSVKKVSLLDSTAERLTAVKHANGCDYWVITNLFGTNSYYAYQVTPCGITDTVISTVGPEPVGVGSWTHLKASPLSNKLATTGQDANDLGFTVLFDFDNSMGVLSNPLIIDNPVYGILDQGISFSPDGKLFYMGVFENLSNNPLYQFRLDTIDIPASKMQIGLITDSVRPSDMQIGADGKIYISYDDLGNYGKLGVINNPDIRGSACDLIPDAVDLAGRYSWLSLPNNITSFLLPDTVLDCSELSAEFSYADSCTGKEIIFTDESSVLADSWLWNFGDSISGASNTSILQNAYHTYDSSGTYMVSLIISACYSDTIKKEITITDCKITPCPDLYIPLAFSPNADGENDVFYIRGGCVKDVSLIIYNRWGEKVFETTDISTGWNGEFLGEKQNTQVFCILLQGYFTHKRRNSKKWYNISYEIIS